MGTITSTEFKLFKDEPWDPHTLGSGATRKAIIGASARGALAAISTIGDGLSTIPTFKPASLSTSSLPASDQAGKFRERILALTPERLDTPQSFDTKAPSVKQFSFPSKEKLRSCLFRYYVAKDDYDESFVEKEILGPIAERFANQTLSSQDMKQSLNSVLADLSVKLEFRHGLHSSHYLPLLKSLTSCSCKKVEGPILPGWPIAWPIV